MSSNEGSEFGTVAVDGSRLQVRIEGTGEPMLVVGSAVFYPRVFSRDLREQFRLVFVDLRHFAPLDDAAMVDQLSIETYADDIEHVRQTLGSLILHLVASTFLLVRFFPRTSSKNPSRALFTSR